jgi:hypothetical protein
MRKSSRAERVNGFIIQEILAVSRLIEQSDHIEQRRFAAPTRTHDRDKFAFFHRQIYPIQRKMLGIAEAKSFRQSSEPDPWSADFCHLSLL